MLDPTEERWLTYRELGEVLRCTPNAARMHAHRRGWSRRAPNRVGDPARVLVPDALVVRDHATHVEGQCDVQPNGAVRPDVRVHVQAIEALREQLAIANARADREALKGAMDSPRSQLEREQNRVGSCRTPTR